LLSPALSPPHADSGAAAVFFFFRIQKFHTPEKHRAKQGLFLLAPNFANSHHYTLFFSAVQEKSPEKHTRKRIRGK